MAFTYYECEEQVDKILSKIDEEMSQKYFGSIINFFFIFPGGGGGVL